MAATLVVALMGAAGGWLIPRGPVSRPEAIVTVLVALGVGVVEGWLLRSRSALLLVPAMFTLVFEVARMRVDGPTVDGIHLGLYGLMAVVAGRGIDALLMLLPMVAGVMLGLALVRGSERVPRGTGRRQLIRRGVLALPTVAVLVLTAALARPASTDAVVGADSKPVTGSIAELVDVAIGGHDQAIMLRGVSTEAPVLLFLEGGPGGTALGRMRNSGEELEQNFVVATWDQRGTGKSYDALEPTATLTLDRMIDDTLAVTNYLRDRFDEQKIYLVGSSWGTILGSLAVQRSPELFHAYVGTGQMVDPFETDTLMYAESLADAEARGEEKLVQSLRDLGPPPYDNTLDYPVAISSNPKWMDFPHGEDYSASSEYPAALFVDEYTLIEQLRGMAAIAETFNVLYPQLGGIDFRQDVPRLDVPVYVVEGRYEANGREVLAAQWFRQLSAASKRYVVFENSGHTPPYDEPGRFAAFMAEVQEGTADGAS
jgi:proline iminopeptidase